MADRVVLYGSGGLAGHAAEALVGAGFEPILWIAGGETIGGDEPLPWIFSPENFLPSSLKWRSVAAAWQLWDGKEWEETSREALLERLGGDEGATLYGFFDDATTHFSLGTPASDGFARPVPLEVRSVRAQSFDAVTGKLRLFSGEEIESAYLFWLRPLREAVSLTKDTPLAMPRSPKRKKGTQPLDQLVQIDFTLPLGAPLGRLVVPFRYRSDRFQSFGLGTAEAEGASYRFVMPVPEELTDQRETLAKIVGAWRRELAKAAGVPSLTVQRLTFLASLWEEPARTTPSLALAPRFFALSPELAMGEDAPALLPFAQLRRNLEDALRALRAGAFPSVDTQDQVSFKEDGASGARQDDMP